LDRRAKVELFEQIRREYEYGEGTIKERNISEGSPMRGWQHSHTPPPRVSTSEILPCAIFRLLFQFFPCVE
jgi:hypothetical protein